MEAKYATLVDLRTDEEVFDYITNKLLEQNEKCVIFDSDGTCAYRGIKSEDLDNAAQLLFGMDYSDIQDVDDMYACADKLEYSLKCAVGHIIADDKYTSTIEEKTVDDETVWNLIVESVPNWNPSDTGLKMLQSLQTIHDFEDPEDWAKEFAKFTFDKTERYVKRVEPLS